MGWVADQSGGRSMLMLAMLLAMLSDSAAYSARVPAPSRYTTCRKGGGAHQLNSAPHGYTR